MAKREEKFLQYIDGAITYIELVRWVVADVTERDIEEHNQYSLSGRGNTASWPFNG